MLAQAGRIRDETELPHARRKLVLGSRYVYEPSPCASSNAEVGCAVDVKQRRAKTRNARSAELFEYSKPGQTWNHSECG